MSQCNKSTDGVLHLGIGGVPVDFGILEIVKNLIVADFLDNFTYYENIGTRTVPVYTSGRLLRELGNPLCGESPGSYDGAFRDE